MQLGYTSRASFLYTQVFQSIDIPKMDELAPSLCVCGMCVICVVYIYTHYVMLYVFYNIFITYIIQHIFFQGCNLFIFQR